MGLKRKRCEQVRAILASGWYLHASTVPSFGCVNNKSPEVTIDLATITIVEQAPLSG